MAEDDSLSLDDEYILYGLSELSPEEHGELERYVGFVRDEGANRISSTEASSDMERAYSAESFERMESGISRDTRTTNKAAAKERSRKAAKIAKVRAKKHMHVSA